MDSQDTQIDQILNLIEGENGNIEFAQGMAILFKLLNNIALNPFEEKYRHIKRSVKAIQIKLYSLKNMELLLKRIGFTQCEDGYTLKDSELGILIGSMDPIRYRDMLAQARLVSEAEYIKAKEMIQFQQQNQHVHQLEEQRKKKLQEQAEYDKQERKYIKVKDSVANEVKFGANVKKCEDIGIGKNNGKQSR